MSTGKGKDGVLCVLMGTNILDGTDESQVRDLAAECFGAHWPWESWEIRGALYLVAKRFSDIDRVIGYVAVTQTRIKNLMILRQIAVAPHERRRGVGRVMLSKIGANLVRGHMIQARVAEGNAPAIGLLASAGWQAYAVERDARPGDDCPDDYLFNFHKTKHREKVKSRAAP